MANHDLRFLDGYTLDDYLDYHLYRGVQLLSRPKKISMSTRKFVKNTRRDYTAQRGDAAAASLKAARAAARAHNAMQNAMPAAVFQAAARQQQRLIEHKTFDSVATPVVMTTDNAVGPAATPFAPVAASTGACLNQVPLGNSSITRVGRKLTLTGVALRGNLTAGTTGTVAKVALILVWDRHVNQSAALPAWTTLLASQSPSALTNKDFASRFKILRRWEYGVMGNQTAGQVTDCSLIPVDEFVPLKNKLTIFTTADSTGLYPDMMEGGLLLYAVSNATGTAAPTLSIMSRVYFQDS